MSSARDVLAEALKEWFADRDETVEPADFILGRLRDAGYEITRLDDTFDREPPRPVS